MLQQTQVKSVIPYYERWMSALPDVQALAQADSEIIHKLWEGLGYYNRVRNMHKAAQSIVSEHQGRFPTEYDKILSLPGVGPYTAGAICSIAFHQPTPILDGNVTRVLTRLFGISGNPQQGSANKKLWNLAEQLVVAAVTHSNGKSGSRSQRKFNGGCSSNHGKVNPPATNPAYSSLNQSLMELGALICTPRLPGCDLCPVRKFCSAYQTGRVKELPGIVSRPTATPRRFVAFVIKRNQHFFVHQRPPGIINSQLWEFPNVEIPLSLNDTETIPRRIIEEVFENSKPVCSIRHSITRFRIRMDVFQITEKRRHHFVKLPGRWIRKDRLGLLPFASAHRKVLTFLGI